MVKICGNCGICVEMSRGTFFCTLITQITQIYRALCVNVLFSKFYLYFNITGQQSPLVIGFFTDYCLGPSLPPHFNLIGS